MHNSKQYFTFVVLREISDIAKTKLYNEDEMFNTKKELKAFYAERGGVLGGNKKTFAEFCEIMLSAESIRGLDCAYAKLERHIGANLYADALAKGAIIESDTHRGASDNEFVNFKIPKVSIPYEFLPD